MFVRHAKEMSQGPNFQFFVSALTRRQLKVGLLGEKLLLTSLSTHGNWRLCISQKLCLVLLLKLFLLRS